MQKGKEKFETLRGRLVHQFLRVFTLIRLSWLSLLFIINITQILLSNRCSTGLPFCFELSQKSFTLLKQLDFLVRRVSSLKAQCRVATKILKNRLYLTNAQTIDCCAKVHNSETGYSPPLPPPVFLLLQDLLANLSRVVPSGLFKADPISDQNMPFSKPFSHLICSCFQLILKNSLTI